VKFEFEKCGKGCCVWWLRGGSTCTHARRASRLSDLGPSYEWACSRGRGLKKVEDFDVGIPPAGSLTNSDDRGAD
jgi:hypothetical protein